MTVLQLLNYEAIGGHESTLATKRAILRSRLGRCPERHVAIFARAAARKGIVALAHNNRSLDYLDQLFLRDVRAEIG